METKKDSLGTRMKEQYEFRSQSSLPRRTYTIIRLDGKAFHTLLRNCKRPYDDLVISAMNQTAQYLCQNIQGCKLGYVQSDEISLVLTDFDTITTEAWFDGNIQKICSVSASLATAKFNQLWAIFLEREHGTLANFDSRCFVIPDPTEVHNYLVWRQQDATRNSIQMYGQAHFSHKELQNKSCNQIQEMLFQQKGINWNDAPDGFKRGRCIIKDEGWKIVDPPVFTQEPDWSFQYIPKLGQDVLS